LSLSYTLFVPFKPFFMNLTTATDRAKVKKLGHLFGATFSFVYVTEGRVFMEFEFQDDLAAKTLAQALLELDVHAYLQPMEEYISVVAEL